MTLTNIASRSVVRKLMVSGRSQISCRSMIPLAPSSSLTLTTMTTVVQHQCAPVAVAATTRSFASSSSSSSSSGGSSFSMDVLKDLRSRSGAPIVECKKALQNSGNDIKAAMAWLREHGAAKASSKLQGRTTSEGLIGLSVSDDGKTASLVKLASETDFAGRNAMCIDLVLNAANASLESSDATGTLDAETILEVSSVGGQSSIKDLLDEAIVAIRENLSFPNVIRMQVGSSTGDDGTLIGYVHNRIDSTKEAGTAAAIVELAPIEGGEKPSLETMQSVGKKLAMHVVAARPQYLSPDDIPQSELEKEKEFLRKEQESSGKPPDIIEKIVLGKLRKYYESVCLIEQAHMIEEKNPKVSKVLKDNGLVLKQFQTLSIT